MKNGYFQVVCGDAGTALKIYAPKEGGAPVSAKELSEYLNAHEIVYEPALLQKGLVDALETSMGEYFFKLNNNICREIKESYSLNISQDKMKAIVRFYAPSVYGERIAREEFLQDLARKKITVGLREAEIQRFFEAPVYCTDIEAAVGEEPRQGKDAKIEYYFKTDRKAKPTLNSDGSVDFFHLNTINHCNTGDVLARLFPAEQGKSGRNIFGEAIKPREVKPAVLKFGRNIAISEDKRVLTSETNGHVTLVEGKVFVSNVLEVENVDPSTGNIDYEGSVKVNGNVCANFIVRAKGDIEVSGIVEGADLEAGGDIILARGMNGMAKGSLRAGGNVITKFLENARVKAGGYVQAGSILHSQVMAGTEIVVSGKRGFITGGKVSAANLIQVKTLGSSMGADTVVEVGVDPDIKARIQQIQGQLDENKKSMDKITPVLQAMGKKIGRGFKLDPEQTRNLQHMIAQGKSLKEAIEDGKRELKNLEKLVDESKNARIEVQDEVYGGTKIIISDVSMVVKNSLFYCRFIKEDGNVKMTAL